MDDVNNIKIDISLQQLSKISVALYLWNLPTIKLEIRKAFASCFRQGGRICFSDGAEKKWPQITELIMSHLSQTRISEKGILDELQEVIINIGEKLLTWGNYVMLELHFPAIFLENISWTSYGAINQESGVKMKPGKNKTAIILTENWLKFRNFFYAWLFDQEKIFNDNLGEIREVLKKLSEPRPVGNKTDMHSVIEQWLSHYRKLFDSDSEDEDDSVEFEQMIRDLPFDSCEDDIDYYADLFLECREMPFIQSVAYLQKKLRKNKKKVLKEALKKAIEQSDRRKLQKDALARTFLFLINKSSGEEKLLFISKYVCEICHVFCDLWPYRELVLPIISILGRYSEHLKVTINFKQLLTSILESLKEGLNKQNCQKTDLFVKILNQIFEIMPKHDKKEMLIEVPCWGDSLFVKILQLRNAQIIEAIFADPDVIEFKNELIFADQTIHFFEEEIRDQRIYRCPNHDYIYKFLGIICLSEEKEKEFKNLLNLD